MFEFLYAKKVKISKEDMERIINDNIEKYYTDIKVTANGTTEIFFGNKRNDE